MFSQNPVPRFEYDRVVAENAKLRDALAPLASCANEYFAEAPQGAHLDTVFTLAEARKAAAAMGWPTHMPRA